MSDDHQPWHLDKRIPIALLATIIVQTFAIGWWASGITTRVLSLETWRADSKDMAADIAVIKSKMIDVQQSQQRMENLIDGRPRSQQQNYVRPDDYRPVK